MLKGGQKVDGAGIVIHIYTITPSRRKDHQWDFDYGFVQDLGDVAKDPALEHFAMVGSQDEPGVIQNTHRFEKIMKPGELSIHIQDEFIVPAAFADDGFGWFFSVEKMGWFLPWLVAVFVKFSIEFGAGVIGGMGWKEVGITHKGLRCGGQLVG